MIAPHELARRSGRFPDHAHADSTTASTRLLRQEIIKKLVIQMPTSCQQIVLTVDEETGVFVLAGVVRTFYAKQVLFRSCRRLAAGRPVVDALDVNYEAAPEDWTGHALLED